MKLTVRKLEARPKEGEPDRWFSDGAVRGSGALWARISPAGVSFYFRYTHAKKKKAVALGGYDKNGTKGLTLKQAREKAGEISKLYQAGITDLHGHLERERQAAERDRRAEEEAARRAAEQAERGTVRQLLDAYTSYLERAGKQSTKDVKSIFKLHVIEAAPDLAARRAADLQVDDFVGIIGALVDAGNGRTADKCRSYLRAAYQLAIESKTNPAAPLALRAFGITANPIASIGALSRFNRARSRVLSAPEMTALLNRLDSIRQGAQRDVLKVCLYLGGQRPAQLLRARPADVDLAAGTITLYDGKGARTEPRMHVLPLVKEAHAILKARLEVIKDIDGAPLFSTDDETSMRPETVSVLVNELSVAMVKAKEAREPFQLRDLRRTAETMLASLKVSRDIRAQIQSHGLGGIQQRHYDRHDYALEKKAALEKWARHLTKLKAGETAEVVAMPKGNKRSEQRV